MTPIDARRSIADASELQQLRLAVEASGEIVFITDAAGIFTYVNPQFCRVYGYEPSDVVNRATPRILKSGLTTPDEYSSFWAQLQQSCVVNREFVNRTKAGRLISIETSANPITNECGRVIGFVAVQRDITERKRTEAALQESERRYRTLAEAAHDSIFIVDRSRRIEYQNEAAKARFGLLGVDTTGKRLDEVFPPDTASRMDHQLSTVFTTGERQLVEERFTTPTGDMWFETWLVPILEGSNVLAVMGVARDVTKRKMLEQQFIQSQKMEAVGHLAGGIAHDFNNLLTAILGYSELLEDRLNDAPDILADVQEIKKAGERASRLTRQLLAFSRKQPMTRQPVDLNGVVGDVQKMLGRILGEDIDLSVLQGDVPEVMADPSQIEQILLNLAVNARDAMPKGGSLTIATANADIDAAFVQRHPGATPGRYASLTLRDTGSGMSEEILAHVFEPFFTTKPQGKGTGLGLSTVYGIVKQNAGYVTIDSRPNDGTCVTVFWPVRDGASASETSNAQSVSRALDGSETVLLVEDEPGIRSLMRKTLEPYGYHVLEAHDVSEAKDLAAKADHIDLLLSDVVMPGLNGPDLAQRIVRLQNRIKVLYMSGFPSVLSDQDRARVAFLAKPFTPLALVRKVRECLDCRTASQEASQGSAPVERLVGNEGRRANAVRRVRSPSRIQ